MDFQILLPGDGMVGIKADASDHRACLEDLYAAVLEGVRYPKLPRELQASITLAR